MHKLKFFTTGKIALILSLLFFTVGILTLPHYGINWDTINHLPRGQAYLHYFLTGKEDYSDLNLWKQYWQNPDSLLIDTNLPKSEVPVRSLYQTDALSFTWYEQNQGGGHPPLSDIFSAAFNRVLFGNLRLINDIDSYRVYGIFLAAVLVGIIYWWSAKAYGKVAGLVAAISLAIYPLFWAESHFNTEKDIPETVFISLLLLFFWRGVVEEKWYKIIISGLFFGFALGTKFNVLFVPFIILPWLIFFGYKKWKNEQTALSNWFWSKRRLFLSMVGAFIIGVSVFVVSWPYLWSDPVGRSLEVGKFYKQIGLTNKTDKNYLGPLKINTYPIQWAVYTTPPVILVLALLGIWSLPWKLNKEKDKLSLIIIFWLAVPILRVTMPGTTIYGGIRQIMEYIPPLAILSGIGAATLLNFSRLKFYKYIIILGIFLSFLLTFYRLVSIHPNENVYFNFLIGGLKGAKEKNIPSWGNSFGAAYRQGISWINKNTEYGSRIALAHGLMPNIPKIWIRSDLDYSNTYRSGYLRRGESAISLVYDGTEDRSYYDAYLSKFIKPSFEVKVDNTAILKVWKNDERNLFIPLEEELSSYVKMEKSDLGLSFDLESVKKLSRLEIEYQELACKPLAEGYTKISINGKDWAEVPEKLPQAWRVAVLGPQPRDGKFIEPFAGQEARFINLNLSPIDTCLKNVRSYKIFTLK